MAVAAGVYGLTLEKMMIDTLAQSIEAETHKELLVLDTTTPDFTVDDFRDDVDGEITGTNYTSGGVTVTTTEVTLSAGTLTFDMADTVYTNVTITDAMGGVFYFNVGTAATDALMLMQDFITAASASAADFTIEHAVAGVMTIDYTP